MIASRYLAMELVDTERVSAPSLETTGHIDPWCADGSMEESDAIGRRNREICRRLEVAFPGTRAANEVEEYDEYLEADLSQEAVLRRLHRCRGVSVPWQGGQMVIRLFDRVTWISLQISDVTEASHPALAAALSEHLHQVSVISGMQPRDALTGAITSAKLAVASLLHKHARPLKQLSRQVARERRQQRLGLPSLIILCLLAVALSVGILASAFDRGNLMLHVDAESPQTFVTESLPPPVHSLWVFPRFFLEGRILSTNQRVRLSVFREQHLRAGLGAPFTVLPTFREERPYVLRTDFDSTGPLIHLGGFGIAWFAVLAVLPPFLAYWFVLRPILRSPPSLKAHRLAGATKALTRLLAIAGVFVLAVWLRTRS